MNYDPCEQDEIIAIFSEMLRAPTRDGGKKREAGVKPNWKVDPGHDAAMFRHLTRWVADERTDPDSRAHPLVHVAWRALAIAWQETHNTCAEVNGNLSTDHPAIESFVKHHLRCGRCAE